MVIIFLTPPERKLLFFRIDHGHAKNWFYHQYDNSDGYHPTGGPGTSFLELTMAMQRTGSIFSMIIVMDIILLGALELLF